MYVACIVTGDDVSRNYFQCFVQCSCSCFELCKYVQVRKRSIVAMEGCRDRFFLQRILLKFAFTISKAKEKRDDQIRPWRVDSFKLDFRV